MRDLVQTYTRVVFPQLKLHAFQRLAILYLLLEKRAEPGQSVTVTLNQFCDFINGSDVTVREYLRDLRARGVMTLEPTRAGFKVLLELPERIPGVIFAREEEPVNVDSIDFYDRRKLHSLLARQGGRCAYSLRQLTPETAEIDHIHPQSEGGDNSYRNVVACSFEMNKRKGSKPVHVFLRELYRVDLLTFDEFEERLAFIAAVVAGERIPTV